MSSDTEKLQAFYELRRLEKTDCSRCGGWDSHICPECPKIKRRISYLKGYLGLG